MKYIGSFIAFIIYNGRAEALATDRDSGKIVVPSCQRTRNISSSSQHYAEYATEWLESVVYVERQPYHISQQHALQSWNTAPV